MRFLLFYSTLLAILQPILCWGDLGHRTVAYLGQKYFTEEASQFTDTLLANNNSWDISDASTWADVVKRRRPETGQWHWIGESRDRYGYRDRIADYDRYRCTRRTP